MLPVSGLHAMLFFLCTTGHPHAEPNFWGVCRTRRHCANCSCSWMSAMLTWQPLQLTWLLSEWT